MEIKLKQLSSLSKVMPWETPPAGPEYKAASALQGEVLSFQLAYSADIHCLDVAWDCESPLRDHITLRQVGLVPVQLVNWEFDDNVITRSPGLFPDPLLSMPEKLTFFPFQWRSIWITLRIPADCPAAIYPVTITLSKPEQNISEKITFEFEVVPARLPDQSLIRTEWFYADCVAALHQADVWSERHWKLLEKYFQNMAEHGINQILTPLFTPPLDTEVGSERPTVQLVDVCVRDNQFIFDFSRLERWIATALNCGLRYFEFSHLYTQWGAKHAPKIVVRHDGREEKMFGWHTDAMSEEYQTFLAVFLQNLVRFIDHMGIRSQCCFHISDEPGVDILDDYRKAGEVIRRELGGFKIMDAMSHLEYYRNGLCPHPVPVISSLEDFVREGIPDLWTYYCCAPSTVTTNRFMNYSGERTRILGFQLYKYDLKGFLHWGYNFWFSRLSKRVIDPFSCPDAGALFPAGDPFLVYPGEDGPLDSIRHELMCEAIQDQRVMLLLESLIGRTAAVKCLEDAIGAVLTVNSYPRSPEDFLNVRREINRRLAKAIG